MSTISADIKVPPRSRTFTESDGKAVLALLTGEAEGQNGTPAQNVGFGEFDTPAQARSAGVALNRLLASLGATQKYAVTSFKRDDKIVGVLLNKPAKKRTEAPANGAGKTTKRGK